MHRRLPELEQLPQRRAHGHAVADDFEYLADLLGISSSQRSPRGLLDVNQVHARLERDTCFRRIPHAHQQPRHEATCDGLLWACSASASRAFSRLMRGTLSGSHHVPRTVMYPSHHLPNAGFTSRCLHSAARSLKRITTLAVSACCCDLP